MARLGDTKICLVRFERPVEIDGLGMTTRIDLRNDPDTGKPRHEGISMTWLGERNTLRVTTAAGETWVVNPTGASMKPVFEDRAAAARKVPAK